jgi:hypothetical protein
MPEQTITQRMTPEYWFELVTTGRVGTGGKLDFMSPLEKLLLRWKARQGRYVHKARDEKDPLWDGVGLGLTACLRELQLVIERHGGRCEVVQARR